MLNAYECNHTTKVTFTYLVLNNAKKYFLSTRNDVKQYDTSISIIPIGSDRNIKLIREGSVLFESSITAVAYRRTGTNT